MHLLLSVRVYDGRDCVVGVLLVPGDYLVPQDGAQQRLDLEGGVHQAPSSGDHTRRQRARHAHVGDQLSQVRGQPTGRDVC